MYFGIKNQSTRYCVSSDGQTEQEKDVAKSRLKGESFTHCSLLYPLPMIEHNVPTQIFCQLVSLYMFIQLLQGTAHYHLFSLNIGTIQNNNNVKQIIENSPTVIQIIVTDLSFQNRYNVTRM